MPVSSKISRTSSAAQSRFARPSSTPRRTGRTSGASQSRFARSTPSTRRSTPVQGLRRRGQPQQSGLKKMLSAVLPAGAAKKATPSSKKGKAGGFALVAAAAGMAFKNRDKLSELRRKDSDTEVTPVTTNAATPPSTPIA